MGYAQETLDHLANRISAVKPQYEGLLLRYVYREYRTKAGAEFAKHGFVRRLKILRRCLENIFELCPPEDLSVPDDLDDTTINIQAFVFNLYGALDNLAWIWVWESPVQLEDGRVLPAREVGLGTDFKLVRRSLSKEMLFYLSRLDSWFSYIKDYRHALAHRIPLYIPPYFVDPKNEEEYLEYDQLIAEAAMRLDFVERDRLRRIQDGLRWFHPVMLHSLDKSEARRFHPQLISDWWALYDIARQMAFDLDGLVTS